MATTVDPAGAERIALLSAATFAGARVLEIGTGDGRLARRYADIARSVIGLELNASDVAAAAVAGAVARDRLRFVRGSGVRLPFGEARFDIALFAWSL